MGFLYLLVFFSIGMFFYTSYLKLFASSHTKNMETELQEMVELDGKVNLTKLSDEIHRRFNNNPNLIDEFDAYRTFSKYIGKYEFFGFIKPFAYDPKGNVNSSFSKLSLAYMDRFCIDHDMRGYSFVDIIRSSVPTIETGRYVYIMDSSSNLNLLKLPFNYEYNSCFLNLYNFNAKMVIIEKDSIKDFQHYGTQVNEVNISTSNSSVGANTIFSEILFGPSFTILNGLSKSFISSTNTVKDLRTVQLIFKDKTDIEFGGIAIYYDLNRHLGIAKNNESSVQGFLNGVDNTKTIESQPVKTIETSAKVTIKCENCGFEAPINAKFCKKCGTPFKRIICVKCGCELDSDAGFCPECGTAVN